MNCKKTLAAMLLGINCLSAFSASLIPNKSSYLYKINPSGNFIPPVSKKNILSIGGSASAKTLLSCHNFNPTLSFKNDFNNIKDSAVGIPSELIDGLTSAIGSVPLYLLQQANPGLYNTLVNQGLDLKNRFNLHVADCNEHLRSMQKGGGMFENIISVSDTEGWIDGLKRAQKGEADVIEVSKSVNKDRGKYGIPWIHREAGNSGGDNQMPINLVSDVVLAGYNLLLSDKRKIDSKEPASHDEMEAAKVNFTRYWSKPEHAMNWATYVLGDQKIKANDDNPVDEAKAGMGLTSYLTSCPKITDSGETCSESVADFFWQIVRGEVDADDDTLRRLSPDGMPITLTVIQTIRDMEQEEQIVAVSTYSEKIAMQNVINQAFMMRRILIAGSDVPEVKNIKAIREEVRNVIEKLDGEIKAFTFEDEVREKFLGSKLETLMNIREAQKANSQLSNENHEGLSKDGAIYIEKEDKA